MDVEGIAGALKLKIRFGEAGLKRQVKGGYIGDLLSDVIANSKEGDIWITRQIHQNIIAVASLKDHAGIILVQGSEPTTETLSRAEQEGIPILVTDLPGFEVAGKIYKILNP